MSANLTRLTSGIVKRNTAIAMMNNNKYIFQFFKSNMVIYMYKIKRIK